MEQLQCINLVKNAEGYKTHLYAFGDCSAFSENNERIGDVSKMNRKSIGELNKVLYSVEAAVAHFISWKALPRFLHSGISVS